MNATEKRIAVRDKYKTLIGRNNYSQSLRDYCFKKYKDGRYYSDCSSSISYSYKEAGCSFGILNTVGMYNKKDFEVVPVTIKNGIIQNPEVLRIGDMLLFAGNDSSRKSANYVGHVEMIGEMGNKIMLYGHGSGNPKRHEMNNYCKERYNSKSSTPLGRKMLIKVVRCISDDGSEGYAEEKFSVLKKGSKGTSVESLQKSLATLGFSCGEIDGDFGSKTEAALKAFQKANGLEANGKYGEKTDAKMQELLKAKTAGIVRITGNSVNVRSLPNTSGKVLCVAHRGAEFDYYGTGENGWYKVTYKGAEAWVSPKYSELK